jgi:hypothetical protein
MDRRLVHGSLRRKARQPALPSPSPKPCGSPVPRRGSPGNPFRGSQIANGRLKTKSPARWPGLFDEDLDTLIVALAPAGCKGAKMTACCGTLVLAAFTKHGIYMAADSRIVGRKSDDAQKIFQCGATALRLDEDRRRGERDALYRLRRLQYLCLRPAIDPRGYLFCFLSHATRSCQRDLWGILHLTLW